MAISLVGCPSSELVGPHDASADRVSAAEVTSWVREIKRDIHPGPRASSVSLFVIPRDGRAAERPPCLESMIQPASIETIIPSPDYQELYASDIDGRLLRRRESTWIPVPSPPQIPPIQALLGFVRARSPLELVVGVDTGEQSDLWTLVLAAGQVNSAGPTDLDAPPYTDAIQFLQAHHTPSCRDGARDCLVWTGVDDRTFIDRLPHRHASSSLPLLELTGELAVADVAWADPDGHSIYLATAGTPCVIEDSG
ncbi:MAG: hypothetical protein AAGF11_16160 [Myxococcota bacterium]